MTFIKVLFDCGLLAGVSRGPVPSSFSWHPLCLTPSQQAGSRRWACLAISFAQCWGA